MRYGEEQRHTGERQEQLHIRGFLTPNRLSHSGYILVGVRACKMRIQA